MWWIILLLASIAVPVLSDLHYQLKKQKDGRTTDTDKKD